MSYELSGKLTAKFDIVQRSESFKTREFVVEKTEEINGKTISNFIKFQCVQDKTTIVDKVNIGDAVKVHFNIKGTKWEKEGRTTYITNLDAWRIEQTLQPGKNTGADKEYEEPMNSFTSSDNTDDLPF
ncbi:hypothetical protein BH09BAC2_BH09BAC2_21560 [soil metagenome]